MPEINNTTYPDDGGRYYRDDAGQLVAEADWLKRSVSKPQASPPAPTAPVSIPPSAVKEEVK